MLLYMLLGWVAWSGMTLAQSPSANSIPVTADNFQRAESDLYFGNAIKDAGGVGKMYHHRPRAEILNGKWKFSEPKPVS